MLSEEALKRLSNLAKIDAKELQDAITASEEKTIEIPEVKTYTDEEFETLTTNLGKEKYTEGRTAGEEMRMKNLKELAGIDFEGYKDPQKFVDTLKQSILNEAKVEPNKKIEENSKTIEELQGIVKSKESEYGNQITELQNKLQNQQLDSILMQKIPDIQGLKPDQALKLFKSEHEIYSEDGNFYVKRNGETLKDELKSPKKVDSVLSEYITENGWLKKPDGRGADDKSGDKGLTIKDSDSFFNYLKENKIPVGSKDAADTLAKIKEEDPEFSL